MNQPTSTRRRGLWTLLAAGIIAALASPMAARDRPVPPAAPKDLIVHEWGTFLSVQGSDGTTLGGMVDSEEALPSFVRERLLGGLNRASMMQKMETPVTFFYTDTPMKVKVRVAMPKGLLTHWFPHVAAFGPMPLTALPFNSFLDWGEFEIFPDKPEIRKAQNAFLRNVPPGNTWPFSRDTDAALVKIPYKLRSGSTRIDFEKFLFYRGLGALDLPLRVRSDKSAGHLDLFNDGKETLTGLFIIDVKKDTIAFGQLCRIVGGGSTTVNLKETLRTVSLKDGVAQVKKAVADSLIGSGLYAKEALAMVNTWEHSYFRTEGLRVLYTIPRPVVDATIPIKIEPTPKELVRVMVGRVEVLTPEKEAQIEIALRDMNHILPNVRVAAVKELQSLGRLAEPVVRRILAKSQDPIVQQNAKQWLAKKLG